LRARPEPTQLTDISDASFLGKLLVLPANVRLPDWKVIARFKHSSLFGLIISNREKKFYNIDTRSMSSDIGKLNLSCADVLAVSFRSGESILADVMPILAVVAASVVIVVSLIILAVAVRKPFCLW
jgi:hypothetical protein